MPKFGHGFHEFFFKVQHREKENCDDYFLRLGIQKIQCTGYLPIKKIGSTKNIFR